VTSGGIQLIAGGGTASGTVVSGGGIDVVDSGGTASGTLLAGGASEFVQSGGVDAAVTIGGGGDIVESGGTATSTTVLAGGYTLVRSGGVDSAVTINGGLFEVASGGSTGSGPIAFEVGGTLQLDASTGFSGLVAGFASISPFAGPPDRLDLRDIAFGHGTTVGFTLASGGTSGTLTASDGTHTANIELLGQDAASHFTAQSDGNGGTIIMVDPQAGAPTTGPGGPRPAAPLRRAATTASSFSLIWKAEAGRGRPLWSPPCSAGLCSKTASTRVARHATKSESIDVAAVLSV
jgi:autotransporter passenger strand-loop-strand repeat protein